MLRTFAALLAPALTRLSWVVLTILGLTCFVIAAFLWDLKAGLGATGVALFLLELRIDFEKRERAELSEQDGRRG
ncbi:hypothetical protein DMC63_01325 [Streptomyces sp. WAC 05977]|nr:hypothetical protein DMC63_01325 [Streptomyces sp. WAC 05977]